MKVITWNVNSIRQRLPRALALLDRHRPDVVCLQETKVADEAFPFAAFSDARYVATTLGQPGRNGVAILSRSKPKDIARGFPGDPVSEQARVVSARVAGLLVVNVYVINGKRVGAPEYELKLRWLDALADWLAAIPADDHVLVAGDFNVAPDERDVHDPAAWAGENLFSEPERARLQRLFDAGFVDLLRLHHDGAGPHTWWDYRAGAFHRGWGLRIDLALGSRATADRCASVMVERDERKPTFGEGAPSDHAPVIVTLEDA